jgi:hypothetical protein
MRTFLFVNIILILIGLQTACNMQNERPKEEFCTRFDDESLLGTWKFIEVRLELKEQFKDTLNWDFPSDYASQFGDKGFLGQDLSSNFRMTFENDSILSLSIDDKYVYKLDENTIHLFQSDYVIQLPYAKNDDVLVISDGLSVIKRTITFEKE